MADLAAAPAFDGLGLPLDVGAARLAVLPEVARRGVMPLRGRRSAVSEALAAQVGSGLPEAGRTAALAEGRIVWAGRGLWFVEGPAAERVDLGARAAVTDQGDGWVGLRLSGPDAREVLARLLPIDTHPSVFAAGSVARTLLRHVMCLVVAEGDGFDILVMRSFAASAADDLGEAMQRVAGRAAIADAASEAR